MTDLTLPDGPSRRIRACSPVILTSRLTFDTARHLVGRSGTVHRRVGDLCSVVLDGLDTVVLVDAAALDLDLTDATGRAHAAWGLATKFEYLCQTPHGPTGAVWRRQRWGWPVWGLTGPAPSVDYPGTERTGTSPQFIGRLEGPEQNVWFQAHAEENWFRVVSALDDIDPDDNRRLPDGYRWADAKALQLVCLHMDEASP